MSIQQRPQGEHRLRAPISDGDWTRGPDDAVATLVEYGDYQCPDCVRVYPAVEEALERLGGRVRHAFRHFPLISLHPRALPAALAAEAAGRQGRFWEMHERLMAARGRLSDGDLRAYAESLGLDMAQFEADMADAELAARVRRGRLDGARSGVNGTPTFFINDRRYDGPKTAAGLATALRASLGTSNGDEAVATACR